MNKNQLRGNYFLFSSFIFVLFSLFSSPTFSIAISDEKYNKDNNIYDKLYQKSREARFDTVGTLVGKGLCTGNWLGSKDGHAYILTAAHCLDGNNKGKDSSSYGQWLSFRTGNGKSIASGKSTSYFNGFSGVNSTKCHDDIAVAKIPLHQNPVNADGETAPQPIIADTQGFNTYNLKPLHFAGHGKRGTPNRGNMFGLGRAYGQGFTYSILGEGCLKNRLSAGKSWAYAAPGDSGSTTWQNFQGQFVGMAVTSYWNNWKGQTSGHGLIYPSIDWLKRVAPIVVTLSSTRKITLEHSVLIQHPEKHVQGSVYYLAGDNVQGPNEKIWERSEGNYTKLVVNIRDENTGEKAFANFRAQRNSLCGWGKINTGAYCAEQNKEIVLCKEDDTREVCEKAEHGGLKIWLDMSDNAHLAPVTSFRGSFALTQFGWHDSAYRESMGFTVAFTTPKPKPKKIMACHWLSNFNWKWVPAYYMGNEARCKAANRCGRGPCFQWREVKQPKPKMACHHLAGSGWRPAFNYSSKSVCESVNRCASGGACYMWRKL